MHARVKLALAVAGGALIGASVLGTAFAATSGTTQPFYGGMMGGITRTASGATSTVYAQMQQFMQQYRTPSGGIDVARMHADVTSGRVTPPCLTRGAGAAAGAYGMMGYARR